MSDELTPAEKRKLNENKAKLIILDWKDKGNTFAEIAQYLNDKGIKTQTGGKWWMQTVHRKFHEWDKER